MIQVTPAPGAVPIMAIAAHPDDIESWCAGTLAQAIDQGATVRLLLVTSGEHGSSDPQRQAYEVAAQREEEAQKAAMLLGITEVVFLRYPDGDVENTRALRADLVAWTRRWQPAIVFTHDPEHPYPAYLCHRDHRVVGRAALDAVYPLARDHLAFAEQVQAGLSPHAVGEVWLFASHAADAYVDISAGFDRKLEARLAHESQTADPLALREGWRKRAASIGSNANLAVAEAFMRLYLD
ncbi:PIG-L deacetylase family protein [Dictyobacter aurantiacus]|uniref:GlcNAc-PI de-N-acetylase n=1 Tax=Dictyobacter aurantiacus TaxID=1936993 RepID=A0A401ZRA6_9CHLR|nr:PIG-L deacetylase family protein [Dictyobacter aurantiacus]GCE09409.1 GlcNAc-PI de-N-acetylase [Dictyobacter aurantiacus]